MDGLSDRIALMVGKERSERAFARKCGFSTQLLRKYLKGTTIPGADKCLAMARAGGVSTDWLLGAAPVSQGSQAQTGPAGTDAPEPTPLPKRVRAEDVQLRRLIDTLTEAWRESDSEMRGWLGPTLRRIERDFRRETAEVFPEWAEKKWGTVRSDNGAA